MLPFTVHEAEIALFHAWNDGRPVQGPLARHLAPGIIASFRAGLTITRQDGGEMPGAFGEWRGSGLRPGGWTIETSAPLAALTDGIVPVDSLPCPGTPVIVMVRFLHAESGQWRLWQFHDAELLPPTAAESEEKMMTAWRIRAGHREEFSGTVLATLPDMDAPVLRGAIEWMHRGRMVRCWDYDVSSNTWTERPENHIAVGVDTARYVTLTIAGDDAFVLYMTPRTEIVDGAGGAIDRSLLSWLNALAFTVSSSGLTPDDDWMLETEGCNEPVEIPASGLHWDHPVVAFSFLGRRYATLSHGVIALPSLADGFPETPPLDTPLRIGRLLLLPDAAYLLPETP